MSRWARMYFDVYLMYLSELYGYIQTLSTYFPSLPVI